MPGWVIRYSLFDIGYSVLSIGRFIVVVKVIGGIASGIGPARSPELRELQPPSTIPTWILTATLRRITYTNN
jgi:hypothetical protein